MSHLTEELVLERLKAVKFPGYSRDIVSFGLVKEIKIAGPDLLVRLSVATSNPAVAQTLKKESEQALATLAGVRSTKVVIDITNPPEVASGGQTGTTKITGVKYVIAIASGKGGVGKSTVAANLAAALDRSGAEVGLCDCDIYGPSISLMFGATQERPMATGDNTIIPMERYGIKLMSMGSLLDDGSPAILRGPMVTRATQQFLRQVDWAGLDYLILDLPPGTGDIQLTVVQTVALSGAVIVTTPQEVALIDARKASAMFAKVNVEVLGIIENMSYFLSPSDGKRYDIFGAGGGEREAARLKVALLGTVPLDIATREAGDRGMPIVVDRPDHPISKVFEKIADQLRKRIEFATNN
ncbi:MAG TPA: Mrp/NBP35 family ATP-binding protein [Chthoniobacterales bacterium]|nr:Mrp/NBP35 family ATP-binding protein [Chthoniobacterales bacterium]